MSSMKRMLRKIYCRIFGHRLIALNVSKTEAECERCGAKLKVSYDMATGETIQEEEILQEKSIILLRIPKMAIIGVSNKGIVKNATVVFNVTHVKQNYHKEGSYTLLGDKEINLGAVYGVGDVQER